MNRNFGENCRKNSLGDSDEIVKVRIVPHEREKDNGKMS